MPAYTRTHTHSGPGRGLEATHTSQKEMAFGLKAYFSSNTGYNAKNVFTEDQRSLNASAPESHRIFKGKNRNFRGSIRQTPPTSPARPRSLPPAGR